VEVNLVDIYILRRSSKVASKFINTKYLVPGTVPGTWYSTDSDVSLFLKFNKVPVTVPGI